MKKMLAVLMAAVLAGSFAGVCALAYSITTDTHLTGEAYDADGDSVVGDYNFAFGDKVSADFVPAGKKSTSKSATAPNFTVARGRFRRTSWPTAASSISALTATKTAACSIPSSW